MSKRIFSSVAVAAVLFVGASRQASAYCTVGAANIPGVPAYTLDQSDGPTPVYLVRNSDTIFGHSTATVGRAVGRAVDAINRYGMADFSLRYGGVLTLAQSVAQPGPGIFIRQGACNVCPSNAIACMLAPTVSGGHVDKAQIRLAYDPTSCPTHDWQFYPDFAGCQPGACADDIQGTITHELLHAAGLAHSGSNGQCAGSDDDSVGIMAIGGSQYSEQRYLSRDDAEGLVALYGRRIATVDYHYSYDGGSSWSDGGLLTNSGTTSALSSVSTATEGETELFFGLLGAPPAWQPFARGMTSSVVNSADAIGGLSVFHPTAVAYGNGTLVAARFINETRTNNSKQLSWVWSTNEGASWSATNAVEAPRVPIHTRRNGLAVAYDPKTVQFIAAYVGDDNVANSDINDKCDDTVQGAMCDELRVVTLDPATGEQHHTNLGVRTATAPSIACGDTPGLRNCVVSWVSATANACIHWGHGRILASGTFEFYNDLATGCTYGFSAPTLSYDDDEPTMPWRMAFTQELEGNSDRIYTRRKGPSYTDAWTDTRSFTVENGFRILGDVGFMHRPGGDKTQVMYVRD